MGSAVWSELNSKILLSSVICRLVKLRATVLRELHSVAEQMLTPEMTKSGREDANVSI